MLGDAARHPGHHVELLVLADLERAELVVVEDAVLLGVRLVAAGQDALNGVVQLLVGDGGIEPVAVQAPGVVVGQAADPDARLQGGLLLTLGVLWF